MFYFPAKLPLTVLLDDHSCGMFLIICPFLVIFVEKFFVFIQLSGLLDKNEIKFNKIGIDGGFLK